MNVPTNTPMDYRAPATNGISGNFWFGSQPSAPEYQNVFNFGRTISLNLANIANIILGILQQLVAQVATANSEPVAPVAPPATGFGNQALVIITSDEAAKTTTINGTTFTDESLRSSFDEFKNSNQYPPLQTRDLTRAPWGYQGSGSTLTAFYNYVVDQAASASAGSATEAPITPIYNEANETVSLGGKDYSFSFLKEKLAEFKDSSSYPSIETMDLQATPWGYEGSSSALSAFYDYMVEQYPNGSTPTVATAQTTASVAAAPAVTTETVAASTSDTTSVLPDSAATPLDAVLDAAAAGDLRNPEATIAASFAPSNS